MGHNRDLIAPSLPNTLLHSLVDVETLPSLHLHMEKGETEDIRRLRGSPVLLSPSGRKAKDLTEVDELQLSSLPLPLRVHPRYLPRYNPRSNPRA